MTVRRHLASLLAAALVVAGSPLVFAAAPLATPVSARTWGDDPLDQVYAAADAVDTCGLNRNQFVAAMLAPSFPETGAPDPLAPSPMTLSRWDTQSALYAFGSSSTAYRRAFWHPGVGLWQFDSAGLGAPYTASQRVDLRVIATPMAQTISARYCAARDAGLSPSDSLARAWTPWHGCNNNRCGAIFLELYNASTGDLRISRDRAVTSTGGMQPRTCRGPGVTGTFSCWRVDPAQAQGYGGASTAWADPAYGGTRTAPLTAPFYVYAAGGFEFRHWLRADTGYSTGVWARRPLGQNARSSLAWAGGEALCDVTADIGACCPTLPVNYKCVGVGVSGDYTPVPGDFNGDGVDDIVWYGSGGAGDFLWRGTVYGRFVGSSITVNGSGYRPVAGDFDGNGTDDIIWYQPGGDHDDRIWRGKRNGTFRGSRLDITGRFTPVAADFNGDRHDDVFWYGDGTRPDFVWFGTRGGFTSKHYTQNGTGLIPLAANYDGDERADIFWYGPDSVVDKQWFGRAGRAFTTSTATQISGTYSPVAGRFNRGRRADILWYSPGAGGDVLYLGAPQRTFEGRSTSIDEEYTPFAGDFNGDGVDDVFWYGPGDAADALTLGG